MAINNETKVLSQNSIYNKNRNITENNRELKVYYSIPENGVNEETGLLLFIAGFGGQATSNVYKKMRNDFSDKYNLVTVQCDYFGYEFMQSEPEIVTPKIDKEQLKTAFSIKEVEEIYKDGDLNFKKFLEFASKKRQKIIAEVKAITLEDEDNFNDMGILQAIDNVTAVLNVLNILHDKKHSFNSKKIIIYGHSHGAYLSYLCNRYCPNLFSLIIDNSAWLEPVYLNGNRYLNTYLGNLTLTTVFDYLAKNLIKDKEALNLNILYSNFKNECLIITYQGVTDNLIDHKEKEKFCKNIDNCIYNEISKEKIDGIVFKSTNHGLNSDFIKMFDYTMSNFNIKFQKETIMNLPKKVIFKTSDHKYVIHYKNGNLTMKIL